MLYTRLTKKALRLMYDVHKDRVDKGGIPYVFHPYEVAEQMNDEISTCVALLHDLIEDSDLTLEYLESAGFPKEVVEAVGLLTHHPNLPYLTYIERLKCNPIAVKVKLADLQHNLDVSRLDNPSTDDYYRLNNYKVARRVLLENSAPNGG